MARAADGRAAHRLSRCRRTGSRLGVAGPVQAPTPIHTGDRSHLLSYFPHPSATTHPRRARLGTPGCASTLRLRPVRSDPDSERRSQVTCHETCEGNY